MQIADEAHDRQTPGWPGKPEKDAFRMALKLARQCERQANLYDDEWRKHMLTESRRHRDRARFWLERYRMHRAWAAELQREKDRRIAA